MKLSNFQVSAELDNIKAEALAVQSVPKVGRF